MIDTNLNAHQSHQKKGLTNLIGALGSMAATSRSKNQAVAQLWFHVVNVWVYMVWINI